MGMAAAKPPSYTSEMSTPLKVEQPESTRAGDMFGSQSSATKSAASQWNARPEVQLLLGCARTTVDKSTAERIRTLLSESIDWQYTIEQASQHRIIPLLWQSLNETCPKRVPAEVLKRLRQHSSSSAHYNLYRTGELIKLLRLFDLNGIAALPFKGPVLALAAYGNLGLRDYGDLDILVRPRDVLKTKRILIGCGYRLVTQPGRHKEPRFSQRNKDLIFDSRDGRVRVELHWRLTGRHFDFPLDLNSLWARPETISLAGSVVRTLAPEDLLLYLCMHGSRHGWERLLWICDVAELLRTHSRMDWELLARKAQRLGSRRTLALGLILARDLLGMELPKDVWRKVQVEPDAESLALHLQKSLFQNEEGDRGISYWHDIHLRMRERSSDRLRLRWHYLRRYLRLALVPNERDHAMLELPPALPFLYYLLRPFRLIRTFGIQELKKRTVRGRQEDNHVLPSRPR